MRRALVLALAALIAIFQVATHNKVLTPTNAQNIINGNAYVLILAIGMVLVIIAGHIDLSVGFLAGFLGAVAAIAMMSWARGSIPGGQRRSAGTRSI